MCFFFCLSLKIFFLVSQDDDGDPFTPSDVDDLAELAQMCVGDVGPIIYKARNLYQLITHKIIDGTDCFSGGGLKVASKEPKKIKKGLVAEPPAIKIVPNPTCNSVAI